MINQYIIFCFQSGTPPSAFALKADDSPCIVAVGTTKSTIVSYFIAIDGKLLPIENSDPAEAFDKFFKTHFVFDTKVNDNLLPYFNFVQSFYYKLNTNFKFTTRMREIRTALTVKQSRSTKETSVANEI